MQKKKTAENSVINGSFSSVLLRFFGSVICWIFVDNRTMTANFDEILLEKIDKEHRKFGVELFSGLVFENCNRLTEIVIPKSVDIEWDSKRLRKEIYGTATVDPFYCLDWGLELTVVCGEETEAIPDEPFRGPVEVAKWYTAEKVTISGKGEWVEALAAKPVIYLYPDEETDVTVTLDYDGELTCTYPKSDGVWNVTAYPDGTLVDANGQEYNYLYWEGITDAEYDFSKGFCIKGEDTAEFLETALAQLGLTRREANEFIVYWLPLMEANEYNVISFQGDNYEEHAKLNVEPAPDTMIRVYMAWYGAEEEIRNRGYQQRYPHHCSTH